MVNRRKRGCVAMAFTPRSRRWTLLTAGCLLLLLLAANGSLNSISESVQNKMAIVVERTGLQKGWGNYTQGQALDDFDVDSNVMADLKDDNGDPEQIDDEDDRMDLEIDQEEKDAEFPVPQLKDLDEDDFEDKQLAGVEDNSNELEGLQENFGDDEEDAGTNTDNTNEEDDVDGANIDVGNDANSDENDDTLEKIQEMFDEGDGEDLEAEKPEEAMDADNDNDEGMEDDTGEQDAAEDDAGNESSSDDKDANYVSPDNGKEVDAGAIKAKGDLGAHGEILNQEEFDNDIYAEDKSNIKYVLFRAIGNDLPPRHAVGQSYRNVEYILNNEPELPGLEKRWVINRIVDQKEEERITDLLKENNQKYYTIPVVLEHYAKLGNEYEGYGRLDMVHSTSFRELDYKTQVAVIDRVYQDKNLYIMNNNGARNFMVDEGIKLGAQWVLPFDGNCFLTEQAWEEMRQVIEERGSETKYFQVPMARLTDNSVLADPGFRPEAKEEPQLVFRNDALERFSEVMRYGRRPKVELLWRLGVPGPWDRWPQSLGPWEKKEWENSTDVPGWDSVPQAGWVARLFSGQSQLEAAGALVDRGIMRAKGVVDLLTKVDVAVATQLHGFRANQLLAYNKTVLAAEKALYQRRGNAQLTQLIGQLIDVCENALTFGPFSVVDKQSLPPSGNKHDYYTVSPYFWPDPDSMDGLPYVRRDGERAPGTDLYDKESDRYDRSRLASMLGNTTTLALGWYFTDRDEYAQKAADNIRAWFLAPATRMTPHLRYAQVQRGHHNDMGTNYGIIETKDFYYLLDAVRLVHQSGFITDDELKQLKDWFTDFGLFIVNSEQGQDEYYRYNNHGVYYDIQMAAIAAFTGDVPRFLNHTEWSKSRLCTQFRPDGTLPHELDRPTSLHYEMFTLQGWLTLGHIGEHAKVGLFDYRPRRPRRWNDQRAIHRGLTCAVPQFNSTWHNSQEESVDMERFYPIYYASLTAYSDLANQPGKLGYLPVPPLYKIKPLFYAHDGVQPFWNLGLVMPKPVLKRRKGLHGRQIRPRGE